MYKVLWFDDKHEEYEDYKEDAALRDIRLIGYTNAKEGLQALKSKIKFDAVLLDGLFYQSELQSGDNVDDEAFGEVALMLANLKSQGIIIPWFIYSGQKKFVKDNNKFVNLFSDSAFANGKVFDKNNDDDFEELCIEIKNAADKQPYTQARHNNAELLKIFELGYLPEVVEENVLELIVKRLPNSNSELKDMLTNIRSIHESCMVKLQAINVIAPSLNSFHRKNNHLSGNVRKINEVYKATTTVYQTRDVQNLHSWIYHTCGTYLHYLEEQHYDGYMISNYAVESLRSGLFELLLWFKKTYEENV